MTLSKNLYFPHIQNPELLDMGLQPISPKQWLWADEEANVFYKNKLAQYALAPNKVYQVEPESKPAQAEFRDVLLEYLLQDQGEVYQRQENLLVAPTLGLQWPLTDDEDLWHSALWIADDVCILLPDGDDYRLSAASLCSPSHWYLGEKFGLPLAKIHKPIPGFDQQLTPSVSRFFKSLKVERPVQRFNWSVQPSDTLSWLDSDKSNFPAETELHWRVERQTLRRLPKTGAVVFTIKVNIHPLAELAEEPTALAALFAAIEQCPKAMKTYKEFDRIELALAKYKI